MPKISSLPPITNIADDDDLPIRDTSATTTKRISMAALRAWLQSIANWITTAMLADGAATDAKWRNGIAFSAMRLGAQTINGGTSSRVLFDTESYDIGNGYDPATGYFTAPVDGIYHFQTVCYTETVATGRAFAAIVTDSVGNGSSQRGLDTDSSMVRRTLAYMDVKLLAGQKAWVDNWVANTMNIGSNQETKFSGHLVTRL